MSSQLPTAYNRPMIVWYNQFSQILQVEIQNALTQNKKPQAALDDAQKQLMAVANEG